MSRRSKPSPWSSLGQYQRDADQTSTSLAALLSASSRARLLTLRAHGELLARPSWPRTAKDTMIEAHSLVASAVASAELAQATHVAALERLPQYYSPNHIHSQAHTLARQHGEVLAQMRVLKKELSAATHGDADHVSRALGVLLSEKARQTRIRPGTIDDWLRDADRPTVRAPPMTMREEIEADRERRERERERERQSLAHEKF
jgi:hypothetical protein